MRYTLIARLLGLAAAVALVAAPDAEAVSGVAPSAPGARALWTAGNKDGFGTSTTLSSKLWFTLGGGELTEAYYPNLGTPAVRDMQFVVTDGKSWVEREREDTNHTLFTQRSAQPLLPAGQHRPGRAVPHRQDLYDGSEPLGAADAGTFRVADQRAAAAVRAV